MKLNDILNLRPVQVTLFCVWVVGAIGGTAVSLTYPTHDYTVIGIATAAMAAMAAPIAFKVFKKDKSAKDGE